LRAQATTDRLSQACAGKFAVNETGFSVIRTLCWPALRTIELCGLAAVRIPGACRAAIATVSTVAAATIGTILMNFPWMLDYVFRRRVEASA
jgi:hypothetical protein